MIGHSSFIGSGGTARANVRHVVNESVTLDAKVAVTVAACRRRPFTWQLSQTAKAIFFRLESDFGERIDRK